MHHWPTWLALLVLWFPAVSPAQDIDSLPVMPAEETLEAVPYIDLPEMLDDGALLRIEYLWWYLKRLPTPPLLTTGPDGSAGVLGEPGAVILRGGEGLKSRHNRYIGVRGRLEWWTPDSLGIAEPGAVGLQADFFFLERDSSYFTIDHGTYPVLAVPYVDAVTGENRSFLVGGDDPKRGELVGGAVVYSRIEVFGQEANVLVNLARSPAWEVHFLAGTRLIQARERLFLTSTSFGPPEGSTLYGLEDKFQTFNKFYGGQVGIEGRALLGRWFLEGKAAAALGGGEEMIRVEGERITHTPAKRVAEPYGLFALPSNLGEHSRWDIDVAGELRVNIGYELTRNIGLLAGYTLMFWDGPVRPGDQVRPVDLSQLDTPGASKPPQVTFADSLFWAQGLSLGVHFHW